MTIPEEKLDDHHCSVIERARIKEDLEACDTDNDSETDRQQCRDEAEAFSKKRERACKYS
jgi:hypothetical protein